MEGLFKIRNDIVNTDKGTQCNIMSYPTVLLIVLHRQTKLHTVGAPILRACSLSTKQKKTEENREGLPDL